MNLLPVDCLDEKQKLRAELIAARTAIFPRQRLEFSNKICDKLFQLPEVQYNENVLSYNVIGAEVDLSEFNKNAIEQNKKIFFPEKIDENNVENIVDVCLVPGVGFDLNGNRLGRGKGFYDKLLPKLNCTKIGIAFECQLVENLPVEPHDAKVNLVITEKRLIRL